MTAEASQFDSWQGKRFFCIPKCTCQFWFPLTPVQWGWGWPGTKQTEHSRVCGAEPPPPCMPAWHTQEQLYRYQIALKTLN